MTPFKEGADDGMSRWPLALGGRDAVDVDGGGGHMTPDEGPGVGKEGAGIEENECC